jgi:hypothetical protein
MPAPAVRRGRKPGAQRDILPLKGNETPSHPVWNPGKSGGPFKWWHAPEEAFRNLRMSGRLLCPQQEVFLREIGNLQFGSRDPSKPPPDFISPVEDAKFAEWCCCSQRLVSMVKEDARARGLVEVRLVCQTWCYRLAFENWPTAPLAPKLSWSSSEPDSSALQSERQPFLAPLRIEHGKTIEMPAFSVCRVSNETPLAVEVSPCPDGTLKLAEANIQKADKPSDEDIARASAKQPKSSVRDGLVQALPTLLESQIQEFFGDFFHKAGRLLDRPLRARIARAIEDSGGTFEQYREFISARVKRSRIEPGPLFAEIAERDFTEFLQEGRTGELSKRAPRAQQEAPFSIDDLRTYISSNAARLRARAGFEAIATDLETLGCEVDELYDDLEELERRLTRLEQRMLAIARSRLNEKDLRDQVEEKLRPHRPRMSAEQLVILESSHMDSQVLALSALPRLSLFYFRENHFG